MANTKISEFSSTPGNNTDIDGINIAEGCAPSGINNAIRELMSQLKDFQAGTAGDSFNGPVGTSTAAAGAFTTLSSTGATTLGDASGDAITINGTATFANANPTLTAGTANGVTYLNGSKVLTSGSALQFDGSNLGLGVTPSAWRSADRAFQVRRSVVHDINQTSSAFGLNYYLDSGNNYRYIGNGFAAQYIQNGGDVGQHQWFTAPSGTAGNAISFTQAMTLTAAGDLLVGTTSANGRITSYSTSDWNLGCVRTGTTTNGHIQFINGNGSVGSITTSGSSTTYVTSSDYRLKENIQPMTGALAKVSALKPCTYKWKVDGSDGEGFIAHELQAVCPDAVTGEKDAVDAEGNPQYQGIDTSFLVATLTAAIQELKGIVDAQGAEIAALKAKA